MARWRITVKRKRTGSNGGITSSKIVEADSESMAIQMAIDRVRNEDCQRDEDDFQAVKVDKLHE